MERQIAIRMKYATKYLLAMLLMFFICSYHADITYASQFYDAREIQLNRDVDDSVINGADYHQNYYRFTTPQSGSITISFSNPIQRNSEEYWKVSLYNAYYEELYTGSVYGNKTRSELFRTGVPSGTYYVKVVSADPRQVKSSDRYTLRVAFDVTDTWEKEPNDNYISATPIELNTDYNGTTRDGSDAEKDYYRLTLTQPGRLDVTFTSQQQKDKEAYWKVHLYNSRYEEICNMLVYGNYRYTALPSIGLDRGVYFIKVTSAIWSHAASTDVYTIRANFQASDVWEKELNEDFMTATPIDLDRSYYGTTDGGMEYEKDVFKFIAPVAGNYRIQVKTPYLRDSGAYWRLSLFDSSYKEITAVDIFGNQSQQYIDRSLSAGTNYIQITSVYWDEARTTEIYELSVTRLNAYGQPDTTQPTVPTQPTTPTQPSNPDDDVCSVEWNTASATLQVGQTTDALVAEVTGDDEVEVYASSNTAIVTVEANGVISAKKVGNASVRAITKRGNVAILNIKVQKKAVATKSIEVNSQKVTLQVGETFELEAEVTPITSSQGIRYTSVNSKIAIVNRNGLIRAKEKGTTTIKAKSGQKTVKVKVTVQ